MSIVHALRYRLSVLHRALLDRRGWRREMDAELGFHLALEEMQQRHAGATPDEARRAARRRLGDPARVRERLVDDSGASALDALWQDLRFAVRALRTRPGFTVVAVLTLAIGIGANAAIFSAVHAMLLRRLPFADPERLVKVSLTAPARAGVLSRDDAPWSYPKFVVFRDAQRAFADLTLYQGTQFTVREGDEAERVRGEYVDARYLPVLGLRPALGRNLAPEEDRAPGGPRVALLGDGLWRRRYGADPAVVGRILHVDGQPYTVLGVLPPGFHGLTGRAELWIPTLAQSAQVVGEAWNHGYTLVARLAPGGSLKRAREEVAQLGRRVDEVYPNPEVPSEHWGASAHPLDAWRVDPMVRRALLVLLGAVGLVLLVVCANVANLLLVRGAERRREIAVRAALGAGRGRLVRQLLTESVLLAALGGVAGVAVAWWGTRALAAVDPTRWLRDRFSDFGAVTFESVRLDGTALALIAGLALLTGIVFGLAPALHATRPGDALKDGGRGASSAGAGRSALAAAEVALAVVLLAGSGLMLRSLGNLLGVHSGVEPRGVLALRLDPRPGLAFDSLPDFYRQLVERVGTLPGVTGATLQSCPPLNGACNGTVLWRRDLPPVPPGQEPEVGVHWITPDWPAVMRVPLMRGRAFTDADRPGASKVVLVSETAARTIWPGEDPIGKPVSVGQGGFTEDTARVVGVVGDVRYGTIDAPPMSDVYLPFYQSPNRMMLFVRAAGDPLALAGPVRRVVRELAPGAPVYELGTLEERFADATAFARFGTLLLSLFAVLALALATLGVYGVVSFAVSQRRREFGVRLALGATGADVVRLVVRDGLAIAGAGTLLGLAAALAAARVLRSLLYDVAPSDPATFAGIVLLLGAAVLAASWLPARRAAGVAPAEALRES